VAVNVTVHAVWTSVTGWMQVLTALTSIPVGSGVMRAPKDVLIRTSKSIFPTNQRAARQSRYETRLVKRCCVFFLTSFLDKRHQLASRSFRPNPQAMSHLVPAELYL
jgi:hypothetical protein